MRLNRRLFVEILRVGAPMSLQPIPNNLALATLTGFVASLGAAELAGFGAAVRLEYLLYPLAFGLGAGVLAIVGTNIGAGNFVRAGRVAWTAAALAAGVTGSIGLFGATLPGAWTGLFTKVPEVHVLAAHYLVIVSFAYPFLGLGLTLTSAFQAAGRPLWPLIGITSRALVVAIGGWITVHLTGTNLIELAVVAGSGLIVYGAGLTIAFRAGVWRTPRLHTAPGSRRAVLPASVSVGQPIAHRLDHMLSGIRAEIALKIYGDDLDMLRNLAESLRNRLTSAPGLADLQVEKQNRIPQLRIEADHERTRLYGVTPASLTRALEGMSNGRTVSQVVTEGNRRFDVMIRLSDADRSTAGLADLLVDTPSGHVPLSLVARIQEADGPNQILREGGQRRIAVYANTDGTRDRAQIIAEIRNFLAATAFPQGYHASLEGTYQAYEDAAWRIAVVSLVSLLLIFLVLQNRYRSSLLALIIMGNVPLALIGSVAALWVTGLPLSVASMMGFVTLAGISTRNGILKISRYVNLVLHEGACFGPDLVMRGSLDRLAPVLLTALSAGLALTPLLRGAGEPGREILHPVAVTIFGGLVSSTLLDAVLTPTLFLAFGRKPLERLSAIRMGARAPTEVY